MKFAVQVVLGLSLAVASSAFAAATTPAPTANDSINLSACASPDDTFTIIPKL